MANSIRWSLIEGHGPPRVGSSKCKKPTPPGSGGTRQLLGYTRGTPTEQQVWSLPRRVHQGAQPRSNAGRTGPSKPSRRHRATMQRTTAMADGASPSMALCHPPDQVQRIRPRPGATGSARRDAGNPAFRAHRSSSDSPPKTAVSFPDGSTVRPQRQDVCDSPHETRVFVLPYNGCTSGLGGAPAPAGASLGME